jgi:hypothetical protein
MLEDLLEAFTGTWGLVAVVVCSALFTENGRRVSRKLAKGAIRMGYSAAEAGGHMIAQLKEEVSDIVSEAEHENENKMPVASGRAAREYYE